MTPATSLHTWVGAFRAMNTRVEAQLVAEQADAKPELVAVEAVFAMYERTLSRFLPTSALMRVNDAAGRWVEAPELLLEAVAEAAAWSRRLPGLFDPTVLDAVVAAGYDRSFEQVPADRPGRAVAARVRGPAGIEIDVAGGRIRLPAGTRLDLGGIGKGLAVDTAVAMLGPRWAGVMVNAGGDIATRGASVVGPWCVAIADPHAPERDLAAIRLRGAEALATSSTMRRRWRVDGEVAHHLIDPGTGRPSASLIVQCTAIASSCAAADVLAKAILLAGPAEGERVLDAGGGAAALAVLADGGTLALGDWEGHLA